MPSIVVSVRTDARTLTILGERYGIWAPKGTLLKLAAEEIATMIDMPSADDNGNIAKETVLSKAEMAAIDAVEQTKENRDGKSNKSSTQ